MFLYRVVIFLFRYHLSGGMQDWQYVHTNALEITIEMGCFKFPYVCLEFM
jgi:hypothetical protein